MCQETELLSGVSQGDAWRPLLVHTFLQLLLTFLRSMLSSPVLLMGRLGAPSLWPTSEAGWSDPSSERTPRLKVVSSAGHMTALLPESAQGSSQVQDFSLAAAWEGLCLAWRNSWRILRTLSQERIQRLFSGTGPFSSDSQHISDSAPSFKIQIEIRTASKPLICSQPHGGR